MGASITQEQSPKVAGSLGRPTSTKENMYSTFNPKPQKTIESSLTDSKP